ncbi:MAG: ROK family protein [Proteobacteria bacterium]|nr:ROK family protein [Pseudomonadota bacterium]
MRIGIDIGGTKIIAGLVDKSGLVTFKKKIPTEKEKGYTGVRDNIAGLIRTIVKEGNIKTEEIERVGIACAGQIDKTTKNILFSPNLDWHNVPLRGDIEKMCGIDTFIENDVNAAVYGEWKFGLKEVPDDVIGVSFGTGIGGGLIINRRLYRGFSYVGGEVGHITLNPHGYKCGCGNTGCFEAYCGGSHIIERVRTEIEEGYRGKIWDIIEGNIGSLHTGHIEEAYLLGDMLCIRIWGEVIEYAGVALASLVNLLNPEVVILGGGVIYGSRYFIEDVKAVMEKRAMKASLAGLKIEKAQLGEDAGIVGAVFVE